MKRFMIRGLLASSFLTGIFLVSCVTINVYFPAAAVEKAADRIVEETWGTKPEGGENGEIPKGPESRLFRQQTLFALLPGAAPAMAQAVDINVSTPAIRALKASIAKRAVLLKPYLQRGAVGIAGNGHLVVRDPGMLKMKEKATLNRLVEQENSEREALYSEIAKANKFSPDRVNDIRSIFAASWIGKAEAGWWIQNKDGAWIKKTP